MSTASRVSEPIEYPRASSQVSAQTLRCPICDGSTTELGAKWGAWKKQWFYLRRCSDCGFSFVANPWTDYHQIYNEGYYCGAGADPLINYVFELESPHLTIRSYEWQGILEVVKSLVPVDSTTEWLDFGCGNGGLVRYCREQAGCRSVGFDEGWIREKAMAANVPCLDRAQLDARPGTFDVVTAIEVLEHVESPIEILSRIRTLLKPGGLFFYTTGNARPYRDRLSKWRYVVPETHISYYEPESLRQALIRCGFRPEFRGYLPGFDHIMRFKILKNLRFKRTAAWQNALPWGLLGRMADARFKVTAHPVAWAC
jgi:SAM-dependent methyltransferase